MNSLFTDNDDYCCQWIQNPMVTRPALRYFGGKWRIAPWIIQHLPEHRCYVEPFGGGASVLLRKPPSTVEVYNDTAVAVVNFFRVLRDTPWDLLASLRLTPFAVDEYATCREQDGSPLERARRFFVRSWGGHHGISGSGRNRGWRRTTERNVAEQFASAADALTETAARLRRVAIDNLDWREVIERYDSAHTTFYVDPPYWRSARRATSPSDGYGEYELDEHDHVLLLECLRGLDGAVVLSGYDNELYRRQLKTWTAHRRRSKTQDGSAVEVLWVNCP
jgi:DNA adenine methylase